MLQYNCSRIKGNTDLKLRGKTLELQYRMSFIPI